MNQKNMLSQEKIDSLLDILKKRFEKNMHRHIDLEWPKIQAKLEVCQNGNANSEKLWSLYEMEKTGGEPDIVGFDQRTGEYIIFECSVESPAGVRSLWYDK